MAEGPALQLVPATLAQVERVVAARALVPEKSRTWPVMHRQMLSQQALTTSSGSGSDSGGAMAVLRPDDRSQCAAWTVIQKETLQIIDPTQAQSNWADKVLSTQYLNSPFGAVCRRVNRRSLPSFIP